MSKSSLKISDDVMSHLRSAAESNRRSLAGQAEHWIRLGREAEATDAASPRVARALRGETSIDELPGDLQEAYLDALNDVMRHGTPEVDAVYAALGARPGAVGVVGDRIVRTIAGARTVPVETTPGFGPGSRIKKKAKAATSGHDR
jgi:hypothetical protein